MKLEKKAMMNSALFMKKAKGSTGKHKCRLFSDTIRASDLNSNRTAPKKGEELLIKTKGEVLTLNAMRGSKILGEPLKGKTGGTGACIAACDGNDECTGAYIIEDNCILTRAGSKKSTLQQGFLYVVGGGNPCAGLKGKKLKKCEEGDDDGEVTDEDDGEGDGEE